MVLLCAASTRSSPRRNSGDEVTSGPDCIAVSGRGEIEGGDSGRANTSPAARASESQALSDGQRIVNGICGAIASLQGELGWSASDIESAVQPFLDDAYDREEREARRAQTPSRAALSQRWVEATRKRMRELPRHPGHDGPTVCCCTECVLWTIAAAALGELDGLAESAFDDEYVVERLNAEVARRDAVLDWIAKNMPRALELCPYKVKPEEEK